MIGRRKVEREEVRVVVESVLREELKTILEGVARLETAHKLAGSQFLQVTGQLMRMNKALTELGSRFESHTHMVKHDETGEELPLTAVMKDLAELMDVLESELNTLRVDQNAYRDALAAVDAKVTGQAAEADRTKRAVLAAFGAKG